MIFPLSQQNEFLFESQGEVSISRKTKEGVNGMIRAEAE